MQKIIDSILVIAMMFTCVASFGQTSILALSSDNLFKAYDNYQKGIYAKAFETFKALSDNGDIHATYGLGVCYYNGRGTTKNLAEAFNCFDKSYSRGNKSAAFILGKCYFYGQGTGKDLDKAEKYLTEAANQGNQEAKTLVSKINAEREKERQKLEIEMQNERKKLEIEMQKALKNISLVGDFVDLGLPSGTLWADRNIGAIVPEDYGCYFAWGETKPKDDYHSATYSFRDSPSTLYASHEAATANWGSGWCMPTRQQYDELLSNCTWTWTTRNGKNGCEIKGRNGNTIFLPAAGYYRASSAPLEAGSHCAYWSSSVDGSDYAWFLFYGSYERGMYHDYRFFGYPVRAVRCRN